MTLSMIWMGLLLYKQKQCRNHCGERLKTPDLNQPKVQKTQESGPSPAPAEWGLWVQWAPISPLPSEVYNRAFLFLKAPKHLNGQNREFYILFPHFCGAGGSITHCDTAQVMVDVNTLVLCPQWGNFLKVLLFCMSTEQCLGCVFIKAHYNNPWDFFIKRKLQPIPITQTSSENTEGSFEKTLYLQSCTSGNSDNLIIRVFY